MNRKQDAQLEAESSTDEEYDRFLELTRKLVAVPKSELDAARISKPT